MNAGVIITRQCPFCGKIQDIEVDILGLLAWEDGACVQKAFPNLSDSEREVIISGICFDCQEPIFKK